jgi:hypothetical protein
LSALLHSAGIRGPAGWFCQVWQTVTGIDAHVTEIRENMADAIADAKRWIDSAEQQFTLVLSKKNLPG